MSAGPRTLGAFASTFIPFSFSFLCGESDEFCLVSERDVVLSFTHPVFLTSPVRGYYVPDASSIVPPLA